MSTARDEFSVLDADAAKGWSPDKGDKLIGTLLDVVGGRSEYGAYPILTIQPQDGSDPVAVHCFHAVLMREVYRLRPMPGEVVGVKYAGKKETKTRGQEVALYSFKVKGRGAADPYADLIGQARPAQAGDQLSVDDVQREVAGDDDIPF